MGIEGVEPSKTDKRQNHITIDVFKIMIYSQSGQLIDIYVNLTVTKRTRNKCIISAEKHVFPSGSSPMKSTFPWMQRRYVAY